MQYTDYYYYVDEYLQGRNPVIPGELFGYWEKQARVEIDRRTGNRLVFSPSLISCSVRDCVCELAELLYQAHGIMQRDLEQGVAGPMTSYSNDGESASFDVSQSVWTEDGKTRKIGEIIQRYLGNTGLLYRGV